jgi:predicted lipid-binding transport protein (Tim44 family)
MGIYQVIRWALLVCGGLMLLGGVVALSLGSAFAGGALWLIATGGILVIVAALERTRYRSEAAERSSDTAGPGGGETAPVEARFRPTDEVFVDPTSQRRMRVLVDPRTGERRYVAEA